MSVYRNIGPLVLKLGTRHQENDLYKICINHGTEYPKLIVRQGQLRSPMHLNGKKGYKQSRTNTSTRVGTNRNYTDTKKNIR